MHTCRNIITFMCEIHLYTSTVLFVNPCLSTILSILIHREICLSKLLLSSLAIVPLDISVLLLVKISVINQEALVWSFQTCGHSCVCEHKASHIGGCTCNHCPCGGDCHKCVCCGCGTRYSNALKRNVCDACDCICGEEWTPGVPGVRRCKNCGGGGCFPGTARVSLENGKSITMAELRVGDRVRTGIATRWTCGSYPLPLQNLENEKPNDSPCSLRQVDPTCLAIKLNLFSLENIFNVLYLTQVRILLSSKQGSNLGEIIYLFVPLLLSLKVKLLCEITS